jgi:hypothetical protein
VEKVSKNLDRKIFHVPLHFIGRDHLVKYIHSWLQDGTHGAAIAILYGIVGVGNVRFCKPIIINHTLHMALEYYYIGKCLQQKVRVIRK